MPTGPTNQHHGGFVQEPGGEGPCPQMFGHGLVHGGTFFLLVNLTSPLGYLGSLGDELFHLDARLGEGCRHQYRGFALAISNPGLIEVLIHLGPQGG